MKLHRPRLFPHISFNAPVILTFFFLSLIIMILSNITSGISSRVLFCTYRASFADPMTWLRLLFHVFGHATWSHYLATMMMLLAVGPMVEVDYGSTPVLVVMVITALVTGLVNDLFFTGTLMGASGIVFALILMSSFAGARDRGKKLPLTVIIVAVLFLGQQFVSPAETGAPYTSVAHIIGGVIGAIAGFLISYPIGRRGTVEAAPPPAAPHE